ncbi:MAG: hypothetical protein IKI97_13675 [Clostridia bacterium]|nr:hypothetical protein [Clostridia bacterium]
MRVKRIVLPILSASAIILELLPYGAVLNFGNPDGEPWRKTFSYFSLTPFGYANFGPLITALLTCVLLILSVICIFKYSKGLNTAIMNISGIATLVSLSPLLFGISYVSAVGVAITVILLAIFGLCFIKEK